MNSWLVGYTIAVAAGIAIVTVREIFQLSVGDWASWVQAIGSICAIVGSVWLAKYQERSAQRKRLQAIFAVAQAARLRVDELARHLNGDEDRAAITFNYHRSIIDGLVSAMSAVPMHELASPDAIIAFASMRDQLVFTAHAIETLIKGPLEHKHLKENLQKIPHATDPVAYRQAYRRAIGVLETNVRVHVDKIHGDFAVLQQELG